MTLKELEELARTARLGLSDLEREMFPEQISHILAYAKQLAAVDTEGVAPTIYPLEQAGVLREDEVLPSLPREKALANAREVVDGYFRVPRIIEED
jgi:aspartyl-tRNA(Asn)/glutamyl-tRNA(Gln) amidotransferase subunit C